VEEVWTRHAENAGVSKEEWWATMAEKTALRRLPMLADVANAAVLLASDHATAITAEITNVTCGELFD
jgi:enoyl-[acyl-carrier-protein] reductase (NADH)